MAVLLSNQIHRQRHQTGSASLKESTGKTLLKTRERSSIRDCFRYLPAEFLGQEAAAVVAGAEPGHVAEVVGAVKLQAAAEAHDDHHRVARAHLRHVDQQSRTLSEERIISSSTLERKSSVQLLGSLATHFQTKTRQSGKSFFHGTVVHNDI